MKDTYLLYANVPEDGSADDCVTTTINKLIAETGDTFARFSGSGPLDLCNADPASGMIDASYQFFIAKACPSAKPEKFAGKTFQEAVAMENDLCPDGDGTEHIASQLELTYKHVTGENTWTSKIISFFGNTADASHCTRTLSSDHVTYDDGCSELTKVLIVSQKNSTIPETPVGQTTSYTRGDYVSLVQRAGEDPYYASGKMSLTVNNWQGTATFLGATTNPIWSLSNGTLQASGTFAPSASLVPSGVRNFSAPKW
jgi:hypothetical protein